MFVHVRCKMHSTGSFACLPPLTSSATNFASPRDRPEVDPPAPQVTEMAVGPSAAMRCIRSCRLSVPGWVSGGKNSYEKWGRGEGDPGGYVADGTGPRYGHRGETMAMEEVDEWVRKVVESVWWWLGRHRAG